MQAFRLLCVEGYLWDLHKTIGYPKQVTNFNYCKNLYLAELDSAIWDIKNGTILTLDRWGHIDRAWKGF